MPDRVVQEGRLIALDVELEAELADVREAHGPAGGGADRERPGRAESERVVRQVGVRERLQQVARVRAHHGEHRVARRHVDDVDPHVVPDVPPHPGRVAHDLRGTRDQQEPVLGRPDHRQVALERAVRVQHRGVDDAVDVDVDVVRAEVLQQREGVRAADQQLAERALVEHGDRLAGGDVLAPVVLEPVLAAEPYSTAGRCPGPANQFEPLRAHLLPEPGAVRGQAVVERRPAEVAAMLELEVRGRQPEVHAERLDASRAEERAVAVPRAEAADVDRPQVEGLLAADDPLGEGLARPAAEGQAGGVEARQHVQLAAAPASRPSAGCRPA